MSTLQAELAKIRHRGYGEDREEFVVGCRCIAMPVHNGAGDVIAAMSVSIPTPRFNQKVARIVRVALADTITRLDGKLGGALRVDDPHS